MQFSSAKSQSMLISRKKDKENWRGYGTSKLEKMFESQILSADQNSTFEELKKKNKLRMFKWSNKS